MFSTCDAYDFSEWAGQWDVAFNDAANTTAVYNFDKAGGVSSPTAGGVSVIGGKLEPTENDGLYLVSKTNGIPALEYVSLSVPNHVLRVLRYELEGTDAQHLLTSCL